MVDSIVKFNWMKGETSNVKLPLRRISLFTFHVSRVFVFSFLRTNLLKQFLHFENMVQRVILKIFYFGDTTQLLSHAIAQLLLNFPTPILNLGQCCLWIDYLEET